MANSAVSGVTARSGQTAGSFSRSILRWQHPSETRNPTGTEADTLHQECEWKPGDRGASKSAADKGLGKRERGNARTVRCLPFPPTVIVGNASTRKGFPAARCCEALTGPVRVAAGS